MGISESMAAMAGGGARKGGISDRMMQGPKAEPQEHGETAKHTTLHDHGDGTFHSEGSDGEKVEHPSIGHAMMHMASKHSDGKHMHIHSDGMGGGHTSHQVSDGGKPEGPHDHENIEALKDHMGKFLNEEENEWGGGDYGKSGGGHERSMLD